MRRTGDAPGRALAVVLPGVALLAALLLAWEAYAAAVSHRRSAEEALRDYAGLAASELVRRATSRVGYEGHYVLVQALGAAGGSAARAARDGDERVRRALPLVRRTFTVDLASRKVSFEGEVEAETAEWLARSAEAPAGRAPYTVLSAPASSGTRTFVLAASREGRLVGYEVEARSLEPFLAAAVDESPLLPASIGHGRVGNDRLALLVRDAAGREVLRRGDFAGALRASATGGDEYAGALRGFTAEVGIDPAAAPDLVIGGLPRSPLPVVLSLAGLSAGLLAATVLLGRRQRALERLRADFVSSASHELRTPLAQVRLFAETLLHGRVRSDEERQHALAVIDRESRRLSHLVENLLQFSRAGRSAAPGTAPSRDLAPLVAEIVESFRPVAQAGGARLVAHVAPGSRAHVDADALRQVVLNLLDNAVKYGPSGQEVRLEVEPGEARLRLTVEDEGPGIPAPDREQVFERFRRLDRDRASGVTGTGLGLAVVRELVVGFGGRCFVETAGGGGTRMVVELPGARAEGP